MTSPSEGLLGRLRRGLQRTRRALGTPIVSLLGEPDREQALRDLEVALVSADVGIGVATEVVRGLRESDARTPAALTERLRAELSAVLEGAGGTEAESAAQPHVTFFVGVNGSGKTTTVGKRAAQLRAEGRRPLLVAADTFRAAAIEQLAAWSERARVPIVRQAPGADPAAVLHDGLTRARERGESPVLVDTAGRLQAKTHLMDELGKMGRVAARLVDGAPHEALLVIDGTTGQNGLSQAREFGRALRLTGLVLTKLDGTAKGGIAFAIAREFGLPIRWVGVGEGVDDLLPFDGPAFVSSLLGDGGAPQP